MAGIVTDLVAPSSETLAVFETQIGLGFVLISFPWFSRLHAAVEALAGRREQVPEFDQA